MDLGSEVDLPAGDWVRFCLRFRRENLKKISRSDLSTLSRFEKSKRVCSWWRRTIFESQNATVRRVACKHAYAQIGSVQVRLDSVRMSAPLCGTMTPLCGTMTPLCGTMTPLYFTMAPLCSGSDRKFGSVRFGSVVRCFFGGSVRFGSVENFARTTEFFVQKMARNRAFSAIFFQLFHENCMDFNVNLFKLFSQTFRMILNILIGAFDDFLEKYLDRKNLVRFGSVR